MTVAVDSRAKIAFHDAEHGGYRADLPLWDELAAETPGTILDLGAGTGRVSLPLLAAGRDVIAVDIDPDLLAELEARAKGCRGTLTTIAADASEGLPLQPASLDLAFAPMQFFHLLAGPEPRQRLLRALARALGPGGLLAAALLEDAAALVSGEADVALPDVTEQDGYVYSSLPLAIRAGVGGIELERLRQVVDPDGRLSEATHTTTLGTLDPALLESEAADAGFVPRGRRPIAGTGDHVASVCVVLEAPGG